MITYYVEVNAMSSIILILLRIHLKNLNTISYEQRTLVAIIWVTILLCLSDMIAGICRGMMFQGAKIVLETSNLIYFEALAVISYLWAVYVSIRLTKTFVTSRKNMVICALPIILFTIVALSNPFTHILFQINEDNLYERNIGVYFHWIVVWIYFLLPTLKALRLYGKETSKRKKQELIPLALFMIAPLVASIIQMICYGVTTTQVGITISIVMICLKRQELQILTDSLTGVNNRRGLESFLSNQIQHNRHTVYSLIMIDVDCFKQINDKYGHMAGDLALKHIAELLKESCRLSPKHMHLARFGGDEFIIIGIDCSEFEINELLNIIADEMEKKIIEEAFPCEISVSIGVASGNCTQEEDLKKLLIAADKDMYYKKSRREQLND